MSKIVKTDRILRRLGVNLWGKPNAAITTRRNKPGNHGTKPARVSDYGLKLIEKQKLRTYYNMNEKPFKRLFKLAQNTQSNQANEFVRILESKLQTFVYRMSWSSTMHGARQLVSHGHVLVNSKRVNIKSFILQEGDVVELVNKAKEMTVVLNSIAGKIGNVPGYIEVIDQFTGKFIRKPELIEVPFESRMNPQAVIEYYTR